MDIGKSFTYLFEDERWLVKVVIGAVFTFLSIFLIGIPFVLGYALETLKNVAEGWERPLPEWSELGDKFVKGLVFAIISIIYAIPIIVVSCLSGLIGQGGDDGLAGLVTACLSCISFLWGIVMALVLPAAQIRYAMTGEPMSAFQFGEMFSFATANLGNYIIAIVVYFIVGILAFVAGAIVCGVGLLFTGFWATLVESHLYGQVYRLAQEQA
jgi:hypothetical protein